MGEDQCYNSPMFSVLLNLRHISVGYSGINLLVFYFTLHCHTLYYPTIPCSTLFLSTTIFSTRLHTMPDHATPYPTLPGYTMSCYALLCKLYLLYCISKICHMQQGLIKISALQIFFISFKRGHILIGTPGRLEDLFTRKHEGFDLAAHVRCLVRAVY